MKHRPEGGYQSISAGDDRAVFCPVFTESGLHIFILASDLTPALEVLTPALEVLTPALEVLTSALEVLTSALELLSFLLVILFQVKAKPLAATE